MATSWEIWHEFPITMTLMLSESNIWIRSGLRAEIFGNNSALLANNNNNNNNGQWPMPGELEAIWPKYSEYKWLLWKTTNKVQMLTHQEMKNIIWQRFLGNLTKLAISVIRRLVIWPILEVILYLMRRCQSLCWSQSFGSKVAPNIVWSVLNLASHHSIVSDDWKFALLEYI